LPVGLVVAEAGFFGGDFPGAFPGRHFGDFSPKFPVGPPATAVADLALEGLGDGDPFGRGEVLADLMSWSIGWACRGEFLLSGVAASGWRV
jgi:hypothetical protein